MNSTTINRKVNIDLRMKKTILQEKPFSPHVTSRISNSKSKSFNNFNNLKTFKKHSSDLSFEGFSFKPVKTTIEKRLVNEAIEYFTKNLGPEAKIAYNKLLKSQGKGFEVIGSKVIFTEESMLKNLTHGVIYPVYHLPVDIINASLKGLSKVPFFKNQNWVKTAQNAKFLKNRREALELNANKYSVWGHVAKHIELKNAAEEQAIKILTRAKKGLSNEEKKSIDKLFEGLSDKAKAQKIKDLKNGLDAVTLENLTQKIFKKNSLRASQKGVDALKGNYNTAAERSLIRLSTGMMAALFLGNDAYNLTRIVNDDHKQAKREKKSRFLQETSRVVLTAYLIFIALESLKKYANKSLNFAVGATLAVTALAEIIGRKVAKKNVLPMSAEKAAQMAQKDNVRMEEYDARQLKREQRRLKKPISFTKTYQNEVFKDFKPRREFAMFEGSRGPKETKGRFNAKKLVGGLAALLFAGFALEKGTSIPKVKKALGGINKKYKVALQKEFTITKTELNEILAKLKAENLDDLAKFYEKNILRYNNSLKTKAARNSGVDTVKAKTIDDLDEVINLGKENRKVLHPLVDKGVLSIPKFFYNTLLTGPYKFLTNFFKKTSEKPKSDVEITRNVLKYIQKHKNSPTFKADLSKKLLASRDKFNQSTYSGADLGIKTKIYTSVLTGLFLVADNYNLVMLKTGGKDKALAEQKAQERAVQRLSRTYYSSTLISVIQKLFEATYNKSLLGAAVMATATHAATDTLTRLSIGLPVGESSREKIFAIEKRNAEATGLKGKFFRTMQFVSGKKRLSDRTVVQQS